MNEWHSRSGTTSSLLSVNKQGKWIFLLFSSSQIAPLEKKNPNSAKQETGSKVTLEAELRE